ncbi:cache domain-containing protein, partial [Campylobacter sp. MIT 21-1685]|uniref:PDC sensor domain-containing protein n=1 Tax=unclassified Campylobacter TaxID=2593542 RepID=UPI00224B0CC3
MSSLKIKLSLIASAISIVALLCLGIISFYFNKNALFSQVVSAEKSYVENGKDAIELFIEKNVKSLEKLNESISSAQYNSQKEFEDFLSMTFKDFKDGGGFMAVYIGFPNGDKLSSDIDSDKKKLRTVRSGPNIDNYDSRTRDWYNSALKTKEVYISPIYTDSATKELVFTFSKAFYKDGKLIGVIAVDEPLTELQDTYDRLPGRVFAFDKDNSIVVSSDHSFKGKDPNILILKEEYSKVKENELFYYTRNDGIERFAICAPASDYTTCIAEDIKIINDPVLKIAYIQTVAVIIIIALSIILLYFIISHFISPLVAIQKGLNSFFDFINHKTKNITTIDVKSNDEFGQIS